MSLTMQRDRISPDRIRASEPDLGSEAGQKTIQNAISRLVNRGDPDEFIRANRGRRGNGSEKKQHKQKNKMKIRNLTTAAFLVGGAILGSQSTFGQLYQNTPNDLMFGFQNQANGGTEDYIINLGTPSTILGKTTVVDLSSDFSMSDFNAVLGGSSQMQGGAIAAANTSTSGQANTADVYVTQLRSGGAGAPSVPGSSVSATMTRANDNNAYASLGTLVSPSPGTGTLDTSKSWENVVDPSTTAFQNWVPLNPDSAVGPSSVLYEDLWETSSSTISGGKPFVYQGYFTLDLTGANPKLTFTSTNVPGSVLSAPKIVSVSRTGSTVTVVSSNAASSHSYQLQYATSLNAPVTWSNAGSAAVASSTTVTNTDSSATGGQRFYRVQAQ